MNYDIVSIAVYALAVGLPLLTTMTVTFSRMLSGEAPPGLLIERLRESIPLLIIAGIAAISFDKFLIPNLAVRRFLTPIPYGIDIARLLLFPAGLIFALVFQPIITFLKPREVDTRFEKPSRSMGLVWIGLGFFLMMGLIIYGSPDDGGSAQGSALRSALLGVSGTKQNQLNSAPQRSKIQDSVTDAYSRLRSKLSSLMQSEHGAVADLAPARQFNQSDFERFSGMVEEKAKKFDLPADIILGLVALESGFDPNFRGNDGGVGLMNVTGGMARQLGIDDFLDPNNNLEVGLRVLRAQADMFGVDNKRAWIAAYHFGTKKIQENPGIVEGDTPESHFVDQVLALAE